MARNKLTDILATLTATLFILSALRVQAQPTIEFVDIGRGSVPLYLPSDYDPAENLPLIVGLHGFTQSNTELENYFNFSEQVESNRFLYLVPEGDQNFLGQTFWNATDACCNFFGSGIDDSGYLRGLVDQVRNDYSVDDRSIHFAGYSNGGFMAHRMAIDHADLVASIVSLAGANYANAAAFSPSEPVHVLQVHGTADGVISYDGGTLAAPYPSAEQTVLHWVEYNGMQPIPTTVGSAFDLDLSVPGLESMSTAYDVNNSQGIAVELWTLSGSGHGPSFGSSVTNRFASNAVPWLLSHRKSASCDFDSNDACDIADIDLLVMEIAAGTNDPSYDLNADSLVNLADRDEWLASAGAVNLPSGNAYLVGDFTLDGVVDGLDFIDWNTNKFTSTGKWSFGDANADGVTDGTDFIEWNANKFTSSDHIQAVPEPSFGSVLVTALSALLISSRRR